MFRQTETRHSFIQCGDHAVEGIRTSRCAWCRYRPMPPVVARFEFLVDEVTDSDDLKPEWNAIESGGLRPNERCPGPTCGGNGSGAHALCGSDSCRTRNSPGTRTPESRRELRTSRITGAKEEYVAGEDRLNGPEQFDGRRQQSHITTSRIAGRLRAIDCAGCLQNLEMVCEQIRGNSETFGEFRWRAITESQFVHYRKPMGITQCRVQAGSFHERRPSHTITQSILSNFFNRQ